MFMLVHERFLDQANFELNPGGRVWYFGTLKYFEVFHGMSFNISSYVYTSYKTDRNIKNI